MSTTELVVAGGFMLLMVALIGLLFWRTDIGKVVTLLGLAGSLYWIVNRVRRPPLVTCIERHPTPSVASAAAAWQPIRSRAGIKQVCMPRAATMMH